jgi:hypothetical protein
VTPIPVGHNSYARTQGLKGVNKMERQVAINRIADLIQLVFDSEPGDGKLEKKYGMDSPFRNSVCHHFYASMQCEEWSKGLDAEETISSHARAQRLIDIALQLTAVRLLNNLFPQQQDIRKKIERVLGTGGVGNARRNQLRQLLEEECKISAEIEKYKSYFNELLLLAKEVGFEVFERGENRFHIYRALDVDS